MYFSRLLKSLAERNCQKQNCMDSLRRNCLLLAEDILTQVIMFWDKKKVM